MRAISRKPGASHQPAANRRRRRRATTPMLATAAFISGTFVSYVLIGLLDRLFQGAIPLPTEYQALASMGVGGVIAGITIWYNRRDVKEWSNRFNEQAAQHKAEIKQRDDQHAADLKDLATSFQSQLVTLATQQGIRESRQTEVNDKMADAIRSVATAVDGMAMMNQVMQRIDRLEGKSGAGIGGSDDDKPPRAGPRR